MLLKDFSIFGSGGHLIWWVRTFEAILAEGFVRNICVKLYEISATSSGDVFFSNFSSGRHFVWQSRRIWAILVERLMRNICVKLF